MKRLSAPKFWMLAKKGKKFSVTPRPGSHPKKRCIPLLVLLRDILGYAENSKEAKEILNKGLVEVDGTPRKDRKYSVGLMDVISLGNDHVRIVPGGHGLVVQNIGKKESEVKLLQIRNKKTTKGGRIQINCHDGRNLLDNGSYKTGDTIVFDVIKKKIIDVLPLREGSYAIITDGKNTGVMGSVEKIFERFGSQPNEAVLKSGKRKITVPQKYVFVLGKEEPVIAMGDNKS